MKSKTKFIIISILVTLLLVYFLLSKISINEISQTIISSDIKYIFIAFSVYFLIYLLRAIRFKILLNEELKFKNIFPIVCIHNFMNMVLPLKTGELSYSYLLKKRSKVRYQKSLSNILIARIMDLGGILFLFLFSLFMYFKESEPKILFFILAIINFLLLIGIFSFVGKFRFISRLKVKNRLLKKIKKFITEIIEESVKYTKKEKLKIIVISLAINSLMFLFGYMLMKSFGVDLSIWAIFVGGTLAFFITLIPLQGLFNFGTLETAWTVSYMLVGLTKEQAIITGFSYHIINIVFTILMFIVGLVLIRKK